MRLTMILACLGAMVLAPSAYARTPAAPAQAMPDALRLLMLDESPTFGTRLALPIAEALAPRLAARVLAEAAAPVPALHFDLRLRALRLATAPDDIFGFERLDTPLHARLMVTAPDTLDAISLPRLAGAEGEGDAPLLHYRWDVRTEMAGILGPTPRRRRAFDTMLTLKMTSDSDMAQFGVSGGVAAVVWGAMARE